MKRLLFVFCLVFVFSCGDDDTNQPSPVDNFDRQEMLSNWADQIIVPGLTDFTQQTSNLNDAVVDFATSPDINKLSEVRHQWEQAYRVWQKVSMFEIGKAEEIFFHNNLNIYPLDVDGLAANIDSGSYNLELPSEIDKQGFPALDYLLYGIAVDDIALIERYSGPEAAAHLDYLMALTERINNLAQTVLGDWIGGYRESFINNSGNNATASTDKLVNDYIFYYERYLRAGKIGIPAGVFSGSSLANLVEAPYRNDISRDLFLEALDATQDFFNGIAYSGSGKGLSLADYLDELEVEKSGQLLSVVINEQFDAARSLAMTLNASFSEQVSSDNNTMLQVYDLLQMNVVYLKVDMLQALNINVDYVDADGD